MDQDSYINLWHSRSYYCPAHVGYFLDGGFLKVFSTRYKNCLTGPKLLATCQGNQVNFKIFSMTDVTKLPCNQVECNRLLVA